MHCNTVIPLQKQNKISVWHELNFHPGKKKKKAISHSLSVCWLLTVSRFRVPDLWCYISHLNASFQLKPSLSELWFCESRVTLRVWESNREIRPLWNNMSWICAVEEPAVPFIHLSCRQNAEVSIRRTPARGNVSARRDTCRKPGAEAQLS